MNNLAAGIATSHNPALHETQKNSINNSLHTISENRRIMNEVWPLLRSLWRGLGAYTISITFDPELDLMEFGDRLGCEYTADHQFSIDANGDWTAQHNYKFLQTDSTWSDKSFNHTWVGSGHW